MVYVVHVHKIIHRSFILLVVLWHMWSMLIKYYIEFYIIGCLMVYVTSESLSFNYILSITYIGNLKDKNKLTEFAN